MAIRDTSAQDTRLNTDRPSPARRKRILMVAAGAIALLALIGWVATGWLAGGRSVDASRVRIATVKRGDLVRDIAADGRVIASNSPSLYAIAGGTVNLHVVAGDAVKEGDVLADIDSPELRSKLAQEESTLASMEADAGRATLDAQLARSNAQKALDQARIDNTTATRDLQRYQRGYEGGAIPQITLQTAQDTMKKAEVGLSSAQRNFKLQGSSAVLDARNKHLLADRQRAVVTELRRQVDALKIHAPFDGQVGQVFVQPRSNLLANAPVLSVVDLSRFDVEIKVPESFARDLAIGMPAQLTGGNKTYPANVIAVSPEVVNGEVSARLRFAEGQQPPGLRQSQRLSARILLDTRRNVLMAERGPALDQSTTQAWLMDGSTAARHAVKVGAASIDAIEIVSGLHEGDKVIVSGAEDFGNTERIRIH